MEATVERGMAKVLRWNHFVIAGRGCAKLWGSLCHVRSSALQGFLHLELSTSMDAW